MQERDRRQRGEKSRKVETERKGIEGKRRKRELKRRSKVVIRKSTDFNKIFQRFSKGEIFFLISQQSEFQMYLIIRDGVIKLKLKMLNTD